MGQASRFYLAEARLFGVFSGKGNVLAEKIACLLARHLKLHGELLAVRRNSHVVQDRDNFFIASG